MSAIASRLSLCIALISCSTALAQSSSLYHWPDQRMAAPPAAGPAGQGAYAEQNSSSPFAAIEPRELSSASTRVIEATSFIAISPTHPRKFKVNDLIKIIVRQQKNYQADGKLDSEDKWNINGELSKWWRFHNDAKHLGADALSNGNPAFKFDLDNKLQNKSTNDRKDAFTTTIGATVIDVKPNGNLVLEAKMHEEHDEEQITITLTGSCRSEDVTPDNSILSTQVADLVLIEKNKGAVRDATKRGWIPRLLDWGKLF